MRSLFILLLVFATASVYAQSPINSSYSRYGIGLMNFNSTASSFALGGATAAWADTNILNYGNPASYTFIARQRPIFDVGIGGNLTTQNTLTQSASSNGSGLRNITLGLPVSKRIGAVIGTAPFSNLGYEISNTILDDDDNEIQFLYNGDGGLTRLFGGLSYAPLMTSDQSFSLGVNVSYAFGHLAKERWILFEDIASRNTKVVSNIQMRGLLIETGFQYHGKINDKINYKIGGTYALSSDLNSKRDALATTFIYNGSGLESSIDTIDILANAEGFVRIPQMTSLGMQLEKKVGNPAKDKKVGMFTIAAQARIEEWGNYLEVFDTDTINDALQRSNTLSLGFEYLPLISLTGDPKYLNLIRYRAGFRYNPTNISIAGETINNYGISFGIGLPLINTRSTSSLNIGFEFGQRGTTDNGLIEERYMQFMVGLSLSPTGFNRWFVKRKYD